MDWHKLQHTLYNLDPTDPKEDLAKLRESVNVPKEEITTIDYVKESIEIPQGSMPLNVSNINDFAKLAGVNLKNQINESDEKKKSSFGQGFAQGWSATKPGGVIGPDRAEKWISDLVTPDSDKSRSKAQQQSSQKSDIRLVDNHRQKDFEEAIDLINKNQKTSNPRHHEAVFQAFRTLMRNPRSAAKILTNLRNQKQEHINLENKKQNSSIKEELLKMLNDKK